MQQAIETAPRDGQFVILVEETTGSFEVARWWVDNWFVENGAPITVRPTHWMPVLQEDDVARPTARAHNARLLSRSFIFLGLPGGAVAAFLVLNAGAPFLSPKPPDAQSVQLPASSAQTPAPNAVTAERTERPAPPAAAASQAKSVTRGVDARVEAQKEQALFREPRRADALARDLATTRWEIEARSPPVPTDVQAAEVAATRQQQELKEERERSAALVRDLAAARRQVDAHNTLTTTVAQAADAAATQQRQTLREERERVAALTQELAAARREIQAHNERAAAAANDSAAVAQVAEAAAMRRRQVAEQERERHAREAAALRQALEKERQRADVLAGELAAARQAIAATTGSADPPRMHVIHVETEATPTHATSNDTGIVDRPVSLETQVSVEAKTLLTTLLARADLFLRQGDISAARVVLERAIEMGSAEARYRLAETYDPGVLSSWRTLGTRGDPAKAMELYARAYAEGIQQAKDRMNALH